jgi:hypothetical protein
MFARLGSIALSAIWLIAGTGVVLAGAALLLLVWIPCVSGEPLCEDIQTFVIYTMFFGQVRAEPLQAVILVVPPLLILFSLPMLFFAYQLLRFFLARDRNWIISYTIAFHLSAVLIVILFNIILGALLNQGFFSDLSETQNKLLNTYLEVGRSVRFGSLLFVLAVILFSLFLLSNPALPPDHLKRRYLLQVNQCRQCGLKGTSDTPPQCVLCQHYFHFQASLLNQGVLLPDAEVVMNLTIRPILGNTAQGSVPIRRIMFEVVFPKLFEYRSHTPLSIWKHRIEKREGGKSAVILTGPDYLLREETIDLVLHIKPGEAERQPGRETAYEISVHARSDYGGGIRPEYLHVRVQRLPRRIERWWEAGTKWTSWLMRGMRQQTRRGLTAGRRRVTSFWQRVSAPSAES